MDLMKVFESAVFLLLFNTVVAERNLQVTITNNNGKDSQIHYKIGQSMSLNCSVTRTNKKMYALINWMKNGNFSSSSNTTYGWFEKKISSLSSSDGGYYQCEAIYNGNTGSAGVFVNLQAKPQIIKCCDGVHYSTTPIWFNKLGDTKSLKCYATGWPLPDLKWIYNGSELTAKAGEEKGTYKLELVQNGLNLQLFGMLNEGNYICQASNLYGRDTNHIKLTAIEMPGDPDVSAVKSHLFATVGQNNTMLTCIGKHVRELDADTLWLHNGKELDEHTIDNSRLVLNTQYYNQKASGIPKMVKMQLTIFNITSADHGNYTCRVYIADKVVHDTILLTVEKKESNIPKSEDRKRLLFTLVIPLAVVLTVILLVIVSTVVFYRYRNKVDPPKIPKGPFKYGAFITYSSHDYQWVKANLLPFLEENGIKTCIHYRNFDIGEILEQNIVNCIYRSRVVIAVISKNYMKSNYCYSELKYAIHRSIEEPGVNSLIALKIDKSIKCKQLPLAIRRKTFLDITSEVEKDTWKQRLLLHVKDNESDQNQNELNHDNKRREDENKPLMDLEENHKGNACDV